MHRILKRGLIVRNSLNSFQNKFPSGKLWKNSVRCVTQSSKSDSLFPDRTDFPSKHIGPRGEDVVTMLDFLGYKVNN